MRFYYEMLEKLKNGTPFKFSRWGDGEWFCMMGTKGKNRDGNEYTDHLQYGLMDILKSYPDYYIGLQPGVLVDVGRGYVPALREFTMHTLFTYSLNLVIGDTLHYASEFGYLSMFVDALKGRHTVIIGAEYFNKLPYQHIITPPANSYDDNDRILKEAREYGNAVFLVASAMNSNIIIDRLPNNVTAIDIGSVFDPYLGIPRATYQHSMETDWLW